MRIVFMGTPDFAVPSLRALIEGGYDVVGVFCQPDRPKGRGHKLAACPVKEAALAAGIPLNDQFLGTGYHEGLRLWGDFGSQLYLVERIDENEEDQTK